MKPYFEDDAVTIYHGDCREILPQLEWPTLLLTDPPYGVGFEYASYEDTLDAWRELMDFLVPWIRRTTQMGILPSCQISELKWIYRHHPPDWLICWYKGSPGTLSFVGFNDWEALLVYGKSPGTQMHDYFYAQPEAPNGHPCPKPIRWATHLIDRATAPSQLVIDPFMGSGTTLRAAKDLGRKAIGIEIEERYCEIAAKRMAQGVLDLDGVSTARAEVLFSNGAGTSASAAGASALDPTLAAGAASVAGALGPADHATTSPGGPYQEEP